jgi:membrane-anchored protein YejM (alkaline phosphatase superfamily)
MKKMKKRIIIFFTIILLTSCQSIEKSDIITVEGDLYFKLIDFPQLFDAPDATLTKIEESIKNGYKDTLTEQDRQFLQMLEYMVDNDLLRKPFIRIKSDEGEILMLFLDPNDYVIFKNYKWSDLREENIKMLQP